MVVVSSGFHKTHVTTAARELSDRGLLRLAITAAYPTRSFRSLVDRLRVADKGRVARLLERDEEIPEQRLRSLFLPELVYETLRLSERLPLIGALYPGLVAVTYRLYGRLAARQLRRCRDADVYLFRAGFGGASIERARELGMVTLCDHALAHPALLSDLIENRGDLSAAAAGASSRAGARLPDPVWQVILEDINRCDAVLVNSDFVKDTFLALGWPEDRIHVVYLGVDDNFLRDLRPTEREVASGRLTLLYAGRLERRKGADALIEALSRLGDEVDWELVVAGPVTPEIEAEHGAFLSDARVKLLGIVRRPELMTLMLSSPIFVLPSYAEGSARAVFEALACGCYVITTPNTGTIVEDGVHGALVPAGDAEGIAAAIVAADRDRRRVADIGTRNAEVVARRYRQTDYGDGLADVYRTLVGHHASSES